MPVAPAILSPVLTQLESSLPRSVSRQSGVTLIEMMVVVVIVSIIASLSFPALTSGLAGVRLSSASGSAASFDLGPEQRGAS